MFKHTIYLTVCNQSRPRHQHIMSHRGLTLPRLLYAEYDFAFVTAGYGGCRAARSRPHLGARLSLHGLHLVVCADAA